MISGRRLGLNLCPDMAPQAPHVHHEITDPGADFLCKPPLRAKGRTYRSTYTEMRNSTSICDFAASFGSQPLPRYGNTGAPRTMKSQIPVLICFASLCFEFKDKPLAPHTSKCETALVSGISPRRFGLPFCPDMGPQAPHVHHELTDPNAALLFKPPFRAKGRTSCTTYVEMRNSTRICDFMASFGTPPLPRYGPTGTPRAP